VLNALTGLYLFNLALKRTRVARTVDEARDSKYPGWRRNDTANFNYPGMTLAAMTIMPVRILIFASAFILIFLALK
jgi:hypothetical protein